MGNIGGNISLTMMSGGSGNGFGQSGARKKGIVMRSNTNVHFVLVAVVCLHGCASAPSGKAPVIKPAADSDSKTAKPVDASPAPRPAAEPAKKPNVIFILADDWGYGDVKCFGGDRCKIDTPHMDQLARDGMSFTNAHSSSSVCTPTRYSILTGRYNWRSRMKRGVLGGFSSRLIEKDRSTVASFLTELGYVTGCVGKWHLGMALPTTDGKPPRGYGMPKSQVGKPMDPKATNVDWKGVIKDGPVDVGFKHYYGFSASLDMPPYIWINDNKFVGECTMVKAFRRPGPAHKDFEDVDVLGIIARKSVEFIHANKDKPIFLYVPLNSPHTPISPSKAWQGKSKLGKYGDFVMETDWVIGQIVKAVDEAGLAENTLIVVTADNGCSPAAKRPSAGALVFNGAKKKPVQPDKHYPCNIYRGHKADIYEGGHRVPFIARWKGRVAKGTTCEDTVCLVDLYATCADMLGGKLGDADAPDSISFLPHLLGTAKGPLREATVHHSINGSFAIRQGKWKLILCPGSGGWSAPKPGQAKGLPPIQLYDLTADTGENVNVQDKHPEVVKKLTDLLTQYIEDGRSTPGAKQENTGKVSIRPALRKKRPKKK
jgi:arylsulfatase A